MSDFLAWQDDFIADGKERWGVGNCWSYLEQGSCDFCRGDAHPTLSLNGGTADHPLSAKMDRYVPSWVQLLRGNGFRYNGATNLHPTMTMNEAIPFLLSNGMKPQHLRTGVPNQLLQRARQLEVTMPHASDDVFEEEESDDERSHDGESYDEENDEEDEDEHSSDYDYDPDDVVEIITPTPREHVVIEIVDSDNDAAADTKPVRTTKTTTPMTDTGDESDATLDLDEHLNTTNDSQQMLSGQVRQDRHDASTFATTTTATEQTKKRRTN